MLRLNEFVGAKKISRSKQKKTEFEWQSKIVAKTALEFCKSKIQRELEKGKVEDFTRLRPALAHY